eukprot:3112518-Prymnesium_polylepis.1
MVELRAMVLQPHEQMETWIKFASLCRKSGRHELTRTSLSKLLPPTARLSTLPVHQVRAPPHVTSSSLHPHVTARDPIVSSPPRDRT